MAVPFGRLLRRVREAKGLSLEQAADLVAFDAQIVAGFERGDYVLYVENVMQFADGYGTEAWKLMFLTYQEEGAREEHERLRRKK